MCIWLHESLTKHEQLPCVSAFASFEYLQDSFLPCGLKYSVWFIPATTTITQAPLDTNINVNASSFLHCVASYNPELDVTYVWYHGDMLVEFERVYRLGENKFLIWYNPHYKRVSVTKAVIFCCMCWPDANYYCHVLLVQ